MPRDESPERPGRLSSAAATAHGRWPAAVAALPVCSVRNLPVPVTSWRNPDTGAGLFGVNDPAAKLACALAGTCGICGFPLGNPMVFLAADHGADPARLLFADPGMHPACAQASLGLCPYIQHERVPSRVSARANAVPGAAPVKPGWIWIASSGYQIEPGRRPGTIVFRPGPERDVRRFRYVSGRLREALPRSRSGGERDTP